MQNSWPRC